MNIIKNDFLAIALEYYEAGIQTIPIHAASINGKGKAPLLEGWTSFGYEHKTEDQIIEAFTRRKDVIGIGLPFGDINPLCAIDIDDCTVEIRNKIPPSLVRRQGRVGREMRFYLKSKGLVSRKYNNIGIEIFANSGQVLLPPSRHIECSCDYIWLTQDNLLSGSSDSLTILKPEMISFLDNYNQTMPEVINLSGGRNNRLVAIATAMISRGITDISEIAKELFNEDKKHDIPLFSDITENYKSSSDDDSLQHAFKFSLSVMSTQHRRGTIEINSVPVLNIYNISSPVLEKNNDYPVLKNSIINTFVDYQRLITGSNDTDALAIGGAIALVSYLAGNKFKSTTLNGYDVRPNMYILNVAQSGAGKSTPQSLLADNLQHDDCVSTEQFKSCQAFLQDISIQQTRLHIIDEASFLLNSMANPEGYQADFISTFLQLFSLSSSRFQGISSKASGKRYGAVNNPSITLLASCTPIHLKNKFNQEMVQGGLFPRFLFCEVKEVNATMEFFDVKKKDSILAQIQKFINSYENVNKQIRKSKEIELQGGNWYNPNNIPLDISCHSIVKDYFKDNEDKKKTELNLVEFYSRANEITAKLALIACLSQGHSIIMPSHYDWAMAMFRTSIKHITPYINEGSCNNDYSKLKNKILQVLALKGSIEKSMLTNYTNESSLRMPVTKQVRDTAINDLVDSGKIVIFKKENSNITWLALNTDSLTIKGN